MCLRHKFYEVIAYQKILLAHVLELAIPPFSAYIRLIQGLKEVLLSHDAETAWTAMSDDFLAQVLDIEIEYNIIDKKDTPFFKNSAPAVLQTGAAREAAYENVGQQEVPPLIVLQADKKWNS